MQSREERKTTREKRDSTHCQCSHEIVYRCQGDAMGCDATVCPCADVMNPSRVPSVPLFLSRADCLADWRSDSDSDSDRVDRDGVHLRWQCTSQ